MFRRFLRRCGRLPLFRLGLGVIILGQLVDGLDALIGLDLAALLPSEWNVTRITAALGVAKITLRGIFVIASAVEAKRQAKGT